LPTAQYSASTTSVSTAYALNGAGMWVANIAEYTYQKSWLQMDLLAVLPIKAVATQGGSTSAYVKQIRVDISSDGLTFQTVSSLLSANTDGTTIVTNSISALGGGIVGTIHPDLRSWILPTTRPTRRSGSWAIWLYM
jgi:hypothetical protein